MKEGCLCAAMRSHDSSKMETHYNRFFVPQRWSIGKRLEGQRYVLLKGTCGFCKQELSQGFLLPEGTAQAEFFSLVYDALNTWRPFFSDGIRPAEYGTVPERRAFWYCQQNKLTLAARHELFLSLFEDGERVSATEWLEAKGS